MTKLEIEGSIHDGFAACLVRNGRTVAHVVEYQDAVKLAALAGKLAATIAGNQSLVAALAEARNAADDVLANRAAEIARLREEIARLREEIEQLRQDYQDRT